jgi:hypothetical protein
VTAEFAMLFPSLMLLLAALIGLFRLGLSELQLAELAVDLARGLARGENPDWVQARLDSMPGARIEQEFEGPLSCVRVTLPFGQSSRACAVDAY